jgi:uncharacterized protein YbjQ (UPF0145 family)
MVQPVAVTTTFTLEGFAIREYNGLVRGIVVRSPTLVQGGRAAATEGLCDGTAVLAERLEAAVQACRP